jgi:hypothetical protein
VLDGGVTAGALYFGVNGAQDHDYGQLTRLPAGFGSGELTVELWIRPDNSFGTGSCASGTSAQLTEWCTQDRQPYVAPDWWYRGNFLLDGHNNSSFGAGTFSLQFYGGGRVRWLFGDGFDPGDNGHWSVGVYPASGTPSLLDGRWHHLAMVRRWQGASSSALELWIDGALIDTELSPGRTDMTQWWSSWSGYPQNQEGWFFGAEKQAAIRYLPQYEDYKGEITELRLYARAKSAPELMIGWQNAVSASTPGLVAWYRFSEGSGTRACDALDGGGCMQLYRLVPGAWR